MNDLHDAHRAEAAQVSVGLPLFDSRGDITPILEALLDIQGEKLTALKDRKNDHLKSRYADLPGVWEAVCDALQRRGLLLLPVPSTNGATVTVRSILAHPKTGAMLGCTLSATGKDATPQAVGSCITYLRRYGLVSMLNVMVDDDDGNAASHRAPPQQQRQAPPARQAAPQQQAQQTRSAPRQEARPRDGAGPAWKEMGWPLCKQGGGYEDMRDPDAWMNTLGRWVANIQNSPSLPADMKPQMIASLREKHAAILDHLEDRGEQAAVADVRHLFRSALKEEE